MSGSLGQLPSEAPAEEAREAEVEEDAEDIGDPARDLVGDEEHQERMAHWKDSLVRASGGFEAHSNFDDIRNEHRDEAEEEAKANATKGSRSQAIVRSTRAGFVPPGCQNLATATLTVSVSGAIGETTLEESWAPANPERVFGSATCWAQGASRLAFTVDEFSTHSQERRRGDIRNTFVINIAVPDCVSDFPVPLGVRFYSAGARREYYRSMNASYAGEMYHLVVPPFARWSGAEDRTCFRNGRETDSPLGELYPWLTPDTVEQGIEPFGNDGCFVPIDHPVALYVYKYGGQKGYPTPRASEKTAKCTIPARVCEEAVRAVRNIVRRDVPAKDLGAFRIEVTALGGDARDADGPDFPAANGQTRGHLYMNVALSYAFRRNIFLEKLDAARAAPAEGGSVALS